MKQLMTILMAIIIIVIAFTQKAAVLQVIHSGEPIAYLISILFVAILVFFPVMPYPLVAGLIGSVFGLWEGILISIVGVMLGTSIMFLMARYGFQQWAQKMISKYPKAKEYEIYFEKNAFLGILFLRLVPIVPSPLLNVLSGISMVSFIAFFTATIIGKLPNIVISTLAGSLFEQNKYLSLGIYGSYFLIISIIITLYWNKKKMKVND
ncbi:TVP38/TMEM64 family protein [Bacillus sp. FJAT-49736]|uniref:TVP38/TMEM64 family protein n=1 Tax=Bacillus sp. FJAT-49736 TaxID=2833582 RepID=UPI001BC9D431|nr:TVP38/TMEM64 family protein [Bacillus sp. FJAT-49736]MBS4173356.1 TVP38/TMEM64 family protein [Bacillus sp. FJAT-49736]